MINPILIREVITLFKRFRTYMWITLYLIILLLIVISTWPYQYYNAKTIDIIRYSRGSLVYIFSAMILLIFILLPSYIATTFVREKEENTLDSLFVTPLSTLNIIFGKIQVAIFYTLYLIIITLPIFGVLYKLGGFYISELIQCYLIVFIISLTLSLWAMVFSIISSTSYKAIGRTYFFFILLIICLIYLADQFRQYGFWNFLVSQYINPFISIYSILLGSPAYFGTYSSYNILKYSTSNLIFGFLYRETIDIMLFYGIISLLLIFIILKVYKKFLNQDL